MSTREDLDAQLIWQVSARSEALLGDVRAGRPAAPALRALLGYLREVVLQRIADEDSRVAARPHEAPPVVAELRSEHLRLREDVEDLAQALGDGRAPRLDGLGGVVQRLVDRLDRHLSLEAVALTDPPTPGRRGGDWAAAVRWYPAIEGAVIDMDDAACAEAQDAVLGRLLQLRPGEHVELHGHGDSQRLLQPLRNRGIGEYSWTRVTGDASGSWAVRVERCAEL
jgi:uncharacterized protein (DUF2249 family)